MKLQSKYDYLTVNGELSHHGILGQKWGVRRYQNPDGTLTEAGKKRYGKTNEKNSSTLENRVNEWKIKNKYKPTIAEKKEACQIILDWMDENKTYFLSGYDIDDGFFYGDKGLDLAFAASNYHKIESEFGLMSDWDGFHRVDKNTFEFLEQPGN